MQEMIESLDFLYLPVLVLLSLVGGGSAVYLWNNKKYVWGAACATLGLCLGRYLLIPFGIGGGLFELDLSNAYLWSSVGIGGFFFVMVIDAYLSPQQRFMFKQQIFKNPGLMLVAGFWALLALLAFLALVPSFRVPYPVNFTSVYSVLALALGAVVLQEYLFRGMILSALNKHLRFCCSVLIQGLVFALSNLGFVEGWQIYLLILINGLYLGWLRRKLTLYETGLIHMALLTALLLFPL